ncbi:MAG TPA: endonuclease III [Candidatus Nanoarchaeia archaeon]|nr:endonuclease III [Candidatus Nanoarchaeia archaeon]
MDRKRAIKQLSVLRKKGIKLRLAADGWNAEWKTLIATLMSARTTDKKTIPVAEGLFQRYKNLKALSTTKLSEVEKLIRGVNFYRTKARNIIALSKILVKDYSSKVPHDFAKLIELPGVGRKTANVFLAEKGHGRIGVDTHVDYISHYLKWTSGKTQKEVEMDLEKLFPKRYWGRINWILVRFGQTYKSRVEKNKILDGIKKI